MPALPSSPALAFERNVPSLPERRFLPRLVGASLLVVCAGLIVRHLVHHTAWCGPLVADTLRSVVGSENVTSLEEEVAGVEDRLKSFSADGSVRPLDDVALVGGATSAAGSADSTLVPLSTGPLHHGEESPNDGSWRPISVRGSETAIVHQTLIHPDAKRPYAELFVYAFELSKITLEAMSGSREPLSETVRSDSIGLVPDEHEETLVAAFNGGFKAEHGHYGMQSQGVEWLAPKAKACTIAASPGGSLRIGTHDQLGAFTNDLRFFRQTPPCMIENGVLHPGVLREGAKGWGATLDGDTVIRRSALGLSGDGKFLFYAMSNSTTASALARGMEHVGATNVAQLDVNHSFPRILFFEENGEGQLVAKGATKGILYDEGEFVRKRSSRDFFYVTLKK